MCEASTSRLVEKRRKQGESGSDVEASHSHRRKVDWTQQAGQDVGDVYDGFRIVSVDKSHKRGAEGNLLCDPTRGF